MPSKQWFLPGLFCAVPPATGLMPTHSRQLNKYWWWCSWQTNSERACLEITSSLAAPEINAPRVEDKFILRLNMLLLYQDDVASIIIIITVITHIYIVLPRLQNYLPCSYISSSGQLWNWTRQRVSILFYRWEREAPEQLAIQLTRRPDNECKAVINPGLLTLRLEPLLAYQLAFKEKLLGVLTWVQSICKLNDLNLARNFFNKY